MLDKVFRTRNNSRMSKMRTILKTLMKNAGHNAHDIFREKGIHPSTIYRYFNNPKGNLEPGTVKKLAMLYGITESQLRGDVPIEGMEPPTEQLELKDLLTLDEYRLMVNVKGMDDHSRDILFQLAEALSMPQADYHANQNGRRREERRREDVSPNPKMRIGDKLWPKPQQKPRLKKHDGRHHINGSESQIA